jgi:hypothetical protein
MFLIPCYSHAGITSPKLPAPREDLNKPHLKKENVVKPVLNGTLIEGILPLAENFHVSEELYLHYVYEMEPACKKKKTVAL